jgi:3-keto-5-aminohexanoate cleavage enzyme
VQEKRTAVQYGRINNGDDIMRKIIIAVAPVALDVAEKIDSVLSPEEIADDVIASYKNGASLVHLHVRDKHGRPTEDLREFGRTLDLIKKDCDIIVQGSTGGVSHLSLEERCVSLNDDRVEMGSLNMGSVNLGEDGYINKLSDIRFWANRMEEKGIVPELEIFEPGMINNVLLLAEEGVLKPPFIFGFCNGFKGTLQANTHNLQFLADSIPAGSPWGYAQHGMKDLSFLAAAIAMGAAAVRVGFEDSVYYAPGKVGKANAILVEKIATLIRDMGFEVASASESRELLGIKSR